MTQFNNELYAGFLPEAGDARFEGKRGFYRFTPERENIYTAEEPRSMTDMLTKAPTRFSAVDCPVCGCQIALAIRAPRIAFPAIVERHDADAEETEGGEDED